MVAFSEIEAYAAACAVEKMEAGPQGRPELRLEPAPCWTDCRTFPGELFRDRVALFIASYPCQGESHAGKRLGHRDPRWLWPAVRRGVETMRQLRCFFENVEGHLTKGLRTVCRELAALRYRVACGVFSAEEVGAPHRRKRVFIMADDELGGFAWPPIHEGPWDEGRGAAGGGGEGTDVDNSPGTRCDDARERSAAVRKGRQCVPRAGRGTVANAAQQHGTESRPEAQDDLRDGASMADAADARLAECTGPAAEAGPRGARPEHAGIISRRPQGHRSDVADAECEPGAGHDEALHRGRLPDWQGFENRGASFPPGPGDLDRWREILAHEAGLEPALCRVADGMANRVDRLRLCGNGVVPDTAALAWLTLDRELRLT